MDEFFKVKGIKREYSVPRTSQQNGVAERRNRTLIEAARTMLADSKLPMNFWAEAVSAACYVQNRVLVVQSKKKTPYELFMGRTPTFEFTRPFRCHVTILNTIDHLGKFDGKANEGYFVGYSMVNKAFRVYNLRTKHIEENLHVNFFENKTNVAGTGPSWMFDMDSLTQSMNYVPVAAGTNTNDFARPEEYVDADGSSMENEADQDHVLMPIQIVGHTSKNGDLQPSTEARTEGDAAEKNADDENAQNKDIPESSSNRASTAGANVSTSG